MRELALGMLGIPMLVLGFILNGFAVYIMWGWFIEPLGVPGIGIAHSLGISFLVTFITHQDVQSPDRDLFEAFILLFSKPLLTLLFGWIFQAFM